jgi:hypothetical protein
MGRRKNIKSRIEMNIKEAVHLFFAQADLPERSWQGRERVDGFRAKITRNKEGGFDESCRQSIFLHED